MRVTGSVVYNIRALPFHFLFVSNTSSLGDSSFTGASLPSLFGTLVGDVTGEGTSRGGCGDFSPVFSCDELAGRVALRGAPVREVTIVYSTEPRNTIPAPLPSCAFQPFPNHHTLKQRLMALRVVRTMLVETEDMRCFYQAQIDGEFIDSGDWV
jgi:hypothetical protein